MAGDLKTKMLGEFIVKKQLALLTAPVILLAAAGTAVADMDFGCLTPYVGVDAQMRHMGYQKQFGGNSLKKNYPQGNFFAGLKFNDCVGVELGYEISTKKSHSRTLPNTDVVFGRTINFAPPFTFTSTSTASSKIHGWNLNLVGYLPVLCEDNSLSLIGSVGVAQLKVRAHTKIRTTVFEPGETPVFTDANLHFHKSKAVLRLAGGAQYMMTECIGVRGLVTWENTSKFKMHRLRETARFVAKPKNTFIYGLGVFTQF